MLTSSYRNWGLRNSVTEINISVYLHLVRFFYVSWLFSHGLLRFKKLTIKMSEKITAKNHMTLNSGFKNAVETNSGVGYGPFGSLDTYLVSGSFFLRFYGPRLFGSART